MELRKVFVVEGQVISADSEGEAVEIYLRENGKLTEPGRGPMMLTVGEVKDYLRKRYSVKISVSVQRDIGEHA